MNIALHIVSYLATTSITIAVATYKGVITQSDFVIYILVQTCVAVTLL